jgi:hypothetical protein
MRACGARRLGTGNAGRAQQLKGAVAESAPTRADKQAHVEAERVRTVLRGCVTCVKARGEDTTSQVFLLFWVQCRAHLYLIFECCNAAVNSFL